MNLKYEHIFKNLRISNKEGVGRRILSIPTRAAWKIGDKVIQIYNKNQFSRVSSLGLLKNMFKMRLLTKIFLNYLNKHYLILLRINHGGNSEFQKDTSLKQNGFIYYCCSMFIELSIKRPTCFWYFFLLL